MKWVLIVMRVSTFGFSAEFDSKETCLAAKAWAENKSYTVKAECFQK